MNNQSLNPFGPNASSSSSSLTHQSFNQLLNANINPNSNRIPTTTTNNPYNNNTNSNNNRTSNNNNNLQNFDFQAMLQNFGLLKPNNSIQSQKTNNQNQTQSQIQTTTNNNNSNKNLLENVLGQLSNFNANNKQNLNTLNTNYNGLFNLTANNTKQQSNSNNNNNKSNNNALNNMLSQLTIPQNMNMNMTTMNPLFNITNQNQNNNNNTQTYQQQSNQLQNNTNINTNNSNNNNTQTIPTNPLFNMSMNNKTNMNPMTNTSTIGMNLNITSTSHQIPLNINLPQISQPQIMQPQPPPLLPDNNTKNEKQTKKKNENNSNSNSNSKQELDESNENNNKNELEEDEIEAEREGGEEEEEEQLSNVSDGSDSDKLSISSSSSSNVEQFLGNLNSKKRKKRSDNMNDESISDSIHSDEPAHKRRKFDLNNLNNDRRRYNKYNKFSLVRDINCSNEIYKKYLSKYNKFVTSHWNSSEIKCKPYIFIKNDIDILYPHKLCNKLLKYGYDDDDDEQRYSQSQLLKLYAENIGIMNTYKQYINLPSVIPITLPIIDCNKLLLNGNESNNINKLLSHPYIIRNWNEGIGIFECNFPLNYSYFDLLLSIGGLTSIRVIDNITNLDIGDEMKLYQYLYLLKNTLPQQREYSMNLISLEISGSILDTKINRPKFVQNIDWISPIRHCWFKNNNFRKYFFSTTNNIRGMVDNEENKNLFYISDGIKTQQFNNEHEQEDEEENDLEKLKESYIKNNITSSGYPEIQKYVLISSANSFTQWHIDFNGSCVWYYMVEGYKYFYIIHPINYEILNKYKQWHIENRQDIWFPEYANCQTQLVILNKNELIILPSGCIHCVYTPVDTIAFGGNFLCDENIEIQLKIEHLYHQIYSQNTVPCCHYFRDLNALKLIEYYYHLRKLQNKNNKRNKNRNKLKDVSHKLFKNDNKKKQNAIDLCIQMLFWLKEEEICGNGKHNKNSNKNDKRLCKFDIINIYKLKPKIYQCLEMLGIKTKMKIQNEMKKFINKYKHYKQPYSQTNSNSNTNENSNSDNEQEEEEEEEEEESPEQEDEEEEVVEDVVIDETQLTPRQRSLRSATKHKSVSTNTSSNKRNRRNKNRNRNRNSNNNSNSSGGSGGGNNSKKKKNRNSKSKKSKGRDDWRTNNDKIECFKCKEKSPVRHMILFVCCSTYYHLRCAGYTTSRTQRSIQQHIDNGTINKQCPVCVKKGLKSKNT